jgi:hypothetical protein
MTTSFESHAAPPGRSYAFGGRTLVRAGLQSRCGGEAKASPGLKRAVGLGKMVAQASACGGEAKGSRGLKPTLLWLVLVLALNDLRAGVVIDRVAVIVDKRVIKLSDIQRDLRVTAFLNRAPLQINPDAMHKSAERLIDQALIAQEIARGGYASAPESDADAMLKQLERDRFGGSEARLRQELARYELSESQLREQLLWQLTVLRFIDNRFRPGVPCGDEAAVDKNFDDWLAEARKNAHIEYEQEAFK